MVYSSLSRSLGSGSTTTEWVRPSDWLAIPSIGSSEQKFIGLFAVFDTDANYVAFTCAGNYTVDWGDGTTQNIASGVQAQKQYTYSSISSSTLSTLGYKQVLITITPQSGQNLTSINLQRKHTGNTNIGAFAVPFLDISLNCASLTTLTVGGSTITLSYLESCIIGLHSVTNMSGMFTTCLSLVSVPLFNTGSVTNMSGMFSACYSLVTVPLFNTISVTNMNTIFNSCYSLASVPLFNTISVTTMISMFANCYSLASVPLFNTASVNNMSNMFAGCSSLASVPLFNTGIVTNISNMFNSCSSLASVPLFNTGIVTNISSMFSNCSSLASVPAFNFTNVTTTTTPFTSCTSLARILVANFSQTFSIASCNLSATALNEIFTNLPTVTAKTITVTGNRGAASCTPSICSIKGWTVVT